MMVRICTDVTETYWITSGCFDRLLPRRSGIARGAPREPRKVCSRAFSCTALLCIMAARRVSNLSKAKVATNPGQLARRSSAGMSSDDNFEERILRLMQTIGILPGQGLQQRSTTAPAAAQSTEPLLLGKGFLSEDLARRFQSNNGVCTTLYLLLLMMVSLMVWAVW